MKIPKIIDNNRVSLLEVLRGVAPKYKELSIATGYWDLPGMQLLIDTMHKYKKIRLLIGREPLIPRHQINQPEPDYPDKDFFYDLERLQPSRELKELVKEVKNLISKDILELEVYRRTFLHAKCYIFGNYDSDEAIGIIGSSNFTKNGLTQNAELNTLEADQRIVTFRPKTKKQEVGHLYWFDALWNDEKAELWNGEFIQLLEQSPVGDVLFNPYETYIKTLYELYKEELEEENLDTTIKGSHELTDFQVKNVHALIRRLNKYKVVMLSDSVGLGKTYTAIDVIKQYLTGEEGLRRVEIICPKSIKAQWTKDLNIQGVRNLMPISLQNPREIEERRNLDHIASVALFVIDESHNLKNRAGKRFEQIIDWIRNNPKAHVLMLTATPINNQLNDITNQILLGTRGEASILKVTAVDKKLKQTEQIDFYQAIENLKKKINQDLTRDGIVDYDYVRQIMTPILRTFVVRRTRQGIEKEYGYFVIDGEQKKFPKVYPEVRKYGFRPELGAQLYKIKSNIFDLTNIFNLNTESIIDNTKDLKHPMDQIEKIDKDLLKSKKLQQSPIYFVYQLVLLLGFLPYRWKMYQTKFYGKTRKQIRELRLSSEESKSLFLQLSIYGILRTIFLKRMESSVSAIRASLETYKRKLAVFEKGIGLNKILSLADLSNIEEKLGMGDEDIDPEDIVFDEEEELDVIDEKKYNIEALRKDLLTEKELIRILDDQLKILEQDDSKIRALASLLEEIHSSNPACSKVLVFSYFADTVTYLEQNLSKHTKLINKDNSAFLSSKNRENSEKFANRFSPKSKHYELGDKEIELNYLVSTDVLSEGQNLQDCGILINYDLHWNPVRMIQRNGRINRIGSLYDVYIYNISPEKQLEEYLRLVHRLEGKINLIRNTIGTDTPVLDEKENPIEFTDSWNDIYSDNLKKRMKAMEEVERETDFLLSEDEYVSDLKIFNNNSDIPDAYKAKIYNIALGKWSLMPQDIHRGRQRPDVLVLNRLYDEKLDIGGHSFISMTRNGSDFQAITHLQALEWLRTAIDNKRSLDKITLDKIMLSKKVKDNVGAYLDVEEKGAPIGQQTEVLRIMFENHFGEKEITQVRLSFQTTNVLDKQKISRLVRKIMRAKRSNKPHLDMLKELVTIAYKTLNIDEKKAKITEIKQVLYYVRDNQ